MTVPDVILSSDKIQVNSRATSSVLRSTSPDLDRDTPVWNKRDLDERIFWRGRRDDDDPAQDG